MKNIYLIGGTMGIGKTTVCRALKKTLPNCVFLDGDWCWDMHPFQVTPETKKMVMENICFLLNQFIRCGAYENIIFCWVMHEQGIIDGILSGLEAGSCLVHTINIIDSGLQGSLQPRIHGKGEKKCRLYLHLILLEIVRRLFICMKRRLMEKSVA